MKKNCSKPTFKIVLPEKRTEVVKTSTPTLFLNSAQLTTKARNPRAFRDLFTFLYWQFDIACEQALGEERKRWRACFQTNFNFTEESKREPDPRNYHDTRSGVNWGMQIWQSMPFFRQICQYAYIVLQIRNHDHIQKQNFKSLKEN